MKHRISEHPQISLLIPALLLVVGLSVAVLLMNTKNSRPINLWDPSGEWIVFACGLDDRRELFLIRPDGSDLYQLTSNNISDNAPRWSPDGGWIAFYAERKNIRWINADNDPEIYIIRPDGSDQRKLTSNKSRDTYPDWSPDGQSIIFVSDRASTGYPSSNDIYAMSLDGNVDLLIADGQALQPRWSPSGEEFAFVSGATSLHIIQADDMRPHLIQSANIIRDPNWSPDGKTIALSYSNTDLVTAIFLMNAVTGETTPLTNSGGLETSPAWSPDGDWIVFVYNFELFKLRVDGSEMQQITDLDCSPNSPDWFAFDVQSDE